MCQRNIFIIIKLYVYSTEDLPKRLNIPVENIVNMMEDILPLLDKEIMQNFFKGTILNNRVETPRKTKHTERETENGQFNLLLHLVPKDREVYRGIQIVGHSLIKNRVHLMINDLTSYTSQHTSSEGATRAFTTDHPVFTSTFSDAKKIRKTDSVGFPRDTPQCR